MNVFYVVIVVLLVYIAFRIETLRPHSSAAFYYPPHNIPLEYMNPLSNLPNPHMYPTASPPHVYEQQDYYQQQNPSIQYFARQNKIPRQNVDMYSSYGYPYAQ